ncbi:DUF4179 domain-containing protein [Brevibacillus parabrevis]|uniref:DUF4179 domain-containing protein n=1 Tax=Brevibacillus parabrevis TaxID=54914 RepID=UPI002E21AA1D|nr:DUF4179 domain-containing protein [Brevibacillus parabrevis]
MKKIAFVSAAVLAIGFSGSVAVSSTFANHISSLWTKKIDPGVQEAVNKGYAKLAKASVTDQGITIETSEVIADPAPSQWQPIQGRLMEADCADRHRAEHGGNHNCLFESDIHHPAGNHRYG